LLSADIPSFHPSYFIGISVLQDKSKSGNLLKTTLESSRQVVDEQKAIRPILTLRLKALLPHLYTTRLEL
jgi:hypothetical protein